jgi:diguanylate cyclase (GGDEF)-like protein/PAS domain S-box-containing protein
MNAKVLNKMMSLCELGYAICNIVCSADKRPVDFIFLESNEIFQKALGVSENEEYTGREIFSKAKYLVDGPKLFKNIMSLIRNKKSGKVDVFYKEGDLTYVLNLVCDDNNTVIMVLKRSNVMDKILFDKNVYYETIVKNMNDLIFIFDLEFKIMYVSPSVNNVIGYSEKELIGKKLEDILRVESLETIDNAYNRALEQNQDSNWLIEITQTHKNGEEIHMEYMVRFLKDDSEKLLGIMCLGRNINSWVRAKEELRANQESLSLLFNSTAEGIFGLDKKGYITFVNKSCLRLLGYKSSYDLIGKHIKVIMGDEYDEVIFYDRFQKVLESGIGHYYEVDPFIRADGSDFVAEYYIYPQSSNGNIIGSVVTFFDITEEIKTQNELYEAERSMSVLLANLPGLAYRCDFDEKYTFRFASQGCYDLIGYYPESLINNRDLCFQDLIVPKYREYLWEKWNALIGKNEIFREEYEIICADGKQKWVLEQGQIIYDNNNNVVALEGIIIDIDEQKQKQAEIEYLSYHDVLTGLNNRTSYERQKKIYLSEKYLPLSIIVGDINGLKLINDALGHFEGDKVLIQTAKLLKQAMPNYFIARTSGDEFLILLPNTDSVTAYEKMKHLNSAVEEYNASISTELLRINLALGFATYESLAHNFSDVVAIAEDYMYKRKLNDRLSSHSAIVSSIRNTMYERSKTTEEHAERMKQLSQMMGKALNLSQIELDELALVSTLHDIGKVGIDDRILNKPDKLTEEEWVEMRRHPEAGYRICMASPELASIAPYVLHHHERWDGTGYPAGIKGEDIPLLARIISIVDAYDAITEDRPYRKARSKEFALEEILKNAGTQFDPNLAKLFVNLMKKEA